MARPKATFSRTVIERVTCPRCAALYEYDRVLSVEQAVGPGGIATVAVAAEVALDREQARPDMAVVRCPACRAYAPGALGNRLLMVISTLGGAVLFGLAALGLILLAGATGHFFWVLALVAALGVPVFLLLSLFALLSPTTHKTRPAGDAASIEPAADEAYG